MDEIVGIIVLDILSDFLQLEVNCFRCIGDRIGDIGKDHMDIMDDSVEY